MSRDPSKYSTIVNVRNIDDGMTNEELNDIFAKYGTLTSYKIMNSNRVELGRFAYVAFEDPDAAEEAIIELNGQRLVNAGQRISLRRTHEKYVRPSSAVKKKNAESAEKTNTTRCEIFVKHLTPDIDASYLRNLFACCGTIDYAKVIKGEGGSKGYGFVRFATPQQANAAVEKMNGRIVEGQSLYVDVARGTANSKIFNNRGTLNAASTSVAGRESLLPGYTNRLQHLLSRRPRSASEERDKSLGG